MNNQQGIGQQEGQWHRRLAGGSPGLARYLVLTGETPAPLNAL